MTGYSNGRTSSSKYAYDDNGERRYSDERPYEIHKNYKRKPNRSPYSRSPSPNRKHRYSSSSDERKHYSSFKEHRRSKKLPNGNVIVMLFLPIATTENDIENVLLNYHLGYKSIEFKKNYDDLTVHSFVDMGSIASCRQFFNQITAGIVTVSQCRIKTVTEQFYEDQVYMGYQLYDTPELPSTLKSDSLARHLINNPPCNVLIFKSLDYSATEDQVRESVTSLTSDPLYDVRVIKDKATGLSRGFCFVEMGNVADATKLLNIILHKSPAYTVGNRRVLAGYARMSSYSSNGLGSLLPSTVDSFMVEKSQHACQVANNAIAAAQFAQNTNNSDPSVTYDPQSGFYYDTKTGYYYDPKSGYYYDPNTCNYLYYDQNTNKWASMPTTSTVNSSNQPTLYIASTIAEEIITPVDVTSENHTQADSSLNANDPKQIAKEMEKWAKKQKVVKKPKPSNHSAEVIANAFKPRSAFQTVQLLDKEVKLQQNNAVDDPFVVQDRLVCLLCVRRFKSKRHLQTHLRLSQLHKDNLLLFNARTAVSVDSTITNRSNLAC